MIIKNVEFFRGNYTVDCYKAPEDKKPIAYLLYNEKALSDEGETCIQILKFKPTKFKPLVERKDGTFQFDIDWLDDLGNYAEMTGKQANDIIASIKEEYEDQ